MQKFTRENITVGDTDIHLIHFEEFEPTDYLQLLSEQEQLRLNSFHHIQRKREFVATRILKHDLFGYNKIEYESHGAPFIKNEGFISISHTLDCCGIAVCQDYKIGLDLEKISPKAQVLHTKFISEQERLFLNTADSLLMTKAWSCKEALYKLSGRKKIIFKNDLIILSESKDEWHCEIVNPYDTISVHLRTIEKDGRILTINTCAIEAKSPRQV